MQCDDDALHLGVLSNVLCLCESSSVNMVLCRSFVLYWKEQALKATVLCYCFHPTQAMGGKAFCSLCWCWCCRGLEVGIYCVVLNCAKSSCASVAGGDGGGGPLHCAVGTRLTPLKSGATTPQILGSLPPFVDPSCLMPFIFLLELFMFRRGTM